jgi:betaine-homocysteine S-methyltransferase
MGLSITERLENGPVLGAEGYVFELERRGYIKAGPFVPEVVLDFPDAVRERGRARGRCPGRGQRLQHVGV